jgi:hypothetical protein
VTADGAARVDTPRLALGALRTLRGVINGALLSLSSSTTMKDSELGGLRRDFGPIAVNFIRAYNCQIVSSPPLLRCEAGSER